MFVRFVSLSRKPRSTTISAFDPAELVIDDGE